MGSISCEITCIIMISLVASTYCSPIKRSIGQRDYECIGSHCEVDMDIATTIDVQFPENLTHVIMSALPNIEDIQTNMFLLIENVTTINHKRNEQYMQNLTSTMAILLGNVANLLQSQLDILNERLPPPPVTVATAPPPPPTAPLTAQPPPPPMDCQDIAAQGPHVSDPYTITPRDNLGPIQVYCDMDTDGGGWTVFQRRFDGTVDFYLDWDQYENGFGSLDGEFWVGLRHIRRLTQTGEWTLHIDLEDFEGNEAYAKYESFHVGDAASNYQLSIGAYSGTAGDSLTYHNNQAFTTKDSDHDTWSSRNCAVYYKGAWWYNACLHSNLNGLWLGEGQESNTGMVWDQWKQINVLKRSEMKMRRVQ